MAEIASPDTHGAGLVDRALDPLRYDGSSEDPHEASGLLRALMPENVRVLDVGCGTGVLTVIMNRAKGNEVLAVEPDTHRSVVARNRGVDVFCGFFDESFIDKRGLFDVIVFADVLEHLASPADMLRAASKALKPGGVILASVPNVAHWSLRMKLLLGRFDYTDTGLCDSTHLRWFTQRSIEALFRSQGFSIVDMRHSAGTFLTVYNRHLTKMLPTKLRNRCIHALLKAFPRLFACQFVLKACKAQ